MRALRTVTLGLLLLAGFAFAYANPAPVAVRIWPGLIWEPPVWALATGALLLGWIPTSLVNRAARWRLSRRIASLEASLAVRSGYGQTEPAPLSVSPHEDAPQS